MSKWINTDAFSKFQGQKKEEQESQPEAGSGLRRSDFVWQTPEKGSSDRPKIYTGRFLVDKKGIPYKKYYYHMFRSGEKWTFIICPKTDDFQNYCPWCSVTSKLYNGTATDKAAAFNYKRKEKFVGNFYIVEDPRDADREADEKISKSVKLYEFPSKVETLLREEIVDVKHGLGEAIFDPSDGGYDFILKVASTKRDRNGKIWPDYSASTFARRSYELGSDSEIKEIMEQTFELDEYIENQKRDNNFILQSLKDERVFDYIKDEWERYVSPNPVSENLTMPDVVDPLAGSNNDNVSDNVSADDDISDDELLKELDKM